MRLPYSVQVFLYRMANNQPLYLLFHRRARPELGLPDFWQGVSGALEASESFSDAARREVAEETGFELKSVSDTGFQHAYPIRPDWRKHYSPGPTEVTERIFVAQLSASSEPTLSSEHESWRWCSALEAKSLLTFGGNAQCLDACERHFNQKPNNSLKSDAANPRTLG